MRLFFLDFSFHHQKLIFEFFVVSLHREPILTALRGKIVLHLKVWSILNHGINSKTLKFPFSPKS